MKAGRLLPVAAVILVCVAGAWFWMRHQDGTLADAAAEPRSSLRSQNAPQTESPASSSSREDKGEEGRRKLRAFLAKENGEQPSQETYEEVKAILFEMVDWNRKELTAVAEELMTGDLSAPGRAYLFGGLLNLLSTKDGAGALALYDRAYEIAGFNRNGKFHVHEMVMNRADQDPVQAAEWVENRRDRLPEQIVGILLEKIRQKTEP